MSVLGKMSAAIAVFIKSLVRGSPAVKPSMKGSVSTSRNSKKTKNGRKSERRIIQCGSLNRPIRKVKLKSANSPKVIPEYSKLFLRETSSSFNRACSLRACSRSIKLLRVVFVFRSSASLLSRATLSSCVRASNLSSSMLANSSSN